MSTSGMPDERDLEPSPGGFWELDADGFDVADEPDDDLLVDEIPEEFLPSPEDDTEE